ncbi:hypothetical protein [Halorubrum sp. AJ67]|uniref:hypothetical protein n=1 Tax=Halorubrum sp. AJ67 TaxID=1173487 RepID=UPI0003DD3EEB|nr:hypothetical protein [Halorubrum sp. AJ67]CDK37990.1 hypothetical protein BN903_190 [Halorubrum sp. AJ67]
MNPFDFSDVADNTTDELRDLLREYILTSSSELHGELVTTRRTRQYIGTGQIVEVTEIEAVQYGTVIQTHDAFVETDAGTALLTYLVETHDFEPSTPYLTNLLRYAFEELDAVTVSETETGDENVQELHVTVSDDESLRGVVDECIRTVTADINEQHQYTLRLALSGAVVEDGPVEINDTHRLRGVDDGLLLGEKRVSNTAPETKRGKNVKSWSTVAEIDMSTHHAFSDAPDVAAEFLAVTLSVFSQSWIAVKNHHTVPQTFHVQMHGFPAPGENGVSLAEIETEHATQINALLELLRPYCDGSTKLQQSNPYFIQELFTPPINLALHHCGEAIIRSRLPQSSIGRVLFGLEALYKQYTEGKTSSRDVARYAAFTIGQASNDIDPEKILADITDAYDYRNQWAHGDQTGEIPEDLQQRLFGYLRCAIVVFAWVDTHTELMTPKHLDIESAFIDESVREEFIEELTGLKITDFITGLPANEQEQ